MTSPTKKSCGYGTSGGIDDASSRIASFVDDDGTTQLAGYSYLGQSAIVEVAEPEPDLKYTLVGTQGGNDPDTGDIYRGLDRFGRVKDLVWYNTGSSTDAARIQHGYDRAGNRLWREDPVAASNGKAFDELYTYDGLYRLKNMQRGTLNSTHTGINTGTETFGQCWTLDSTGNWQGFRTDDTGDGTWDLVQARTANPVNEITAITNSTGPTWAQPAYDPAGNMTTIPRTADPTLGYTATYDAWNMLTKLVDPATSNTVQENAYDGRRFRVVRKDYAAGVLSEERHFYYTSGWQSIEERLGSTPDTASPECQYVWGLRYIDDFLLRDRDTSNIGALDERLYALQDPNWNVVAITDDSGTVQERYAYSAYGTPIYLSPSFILRSASLFASNALYAGYMHDITPTLYAIRYRTYNSVIGAWSQRDPIGYRGGINLYLISNSTPLNKVDPSGLDSASVGLSIGISYYERLGGGLSVTLNETMEPCCLGGVQGTKLIDDFRIHGEIGVGAGGDVNMGFAQVAVELKFVTAYIDIGRRCETSCAVGRPSGRANCCRFCTDIGINAPSPMFPIATLSLGLGVGVEFSALTTGSFRVCYNSTNCSRLGLAVGFCGGITMEMIATYWLGTTGVKKDLLSGCAALIGSESMLGF